MTGTGFDRLDFNYGEMKNPGFDLPGEGANAGDFIKLSQLYSGRRLDAKGDAVPPSKHKRQELWRELTAKLPAEFEVFPKTAVEWRIGQLRLLIYANRLEFFAFHRRLLAAELVESGWQASAWTEEDIERDLVEIVKHAVAVQGGRHNFVTRVFHGDKDINSKAAPDVLALYLPKLSLIRLHALALHGRDAAATAAADAIALHWPKNATILYNCACVYALAAGAVGGNAALTERYAVRAVALLRQSVAEGHDESQPGRFRKDPDLDALRLLKDPDLDALRQRDDFQKLLKKLNTN